MYLFASFVLFFGAPAMRHSRIRPPFGPICCWQIRPENTSHMSRNTPIMLRYPCVVHTPSSNHDDNTAYRSPQKLRTLNVGHRVSPLHTRDASLVASTRTKAGGTGGSLHTRDASLVASTFVRQSPKKKALPNGNAFSFHSQLNRKSHARPSGNRNRFLHVHP